MMEDWVECQLGDVIEIISGKNQKQVTSVNGKYPIYGSGGIIGKATEFLCNEGTTIIGRKGTINSPIFVKEKFWNVDTAFGLSPSKKILPKLLYYFCIGFNFKKLDKSTTIPSLAKRDLLKISILLPPLPIQRAIVARIEELFSSLDQGVADLQRAQEQLRVYRQAVLKKAFEGENVKTNEKQYIKLKTVIEKPRYGTSKKCTKDSNGTPVLRIPNIVRGYINSQDLKYAKFSEKEISPLILREGDLLIIRSNGSVNLVGKAAIVTKKDTGYLFAGYLIRAPSKSKQYQY